MPRETARAIHLSVKMQSSVSQEDRATGRPQTPRVACAAEEVAALGDCLRAEASAETICWQRVFQM